MASPLVAPEDLYSRIYQNDLDEIIRAEEKIVTKAIQAAMAEAKMYLGRYDTRALLDTEDSNATHHDAYLKQLCIHIAVWYLVLLGNPGIDFNTARAGYENAINSLRDIQAFRMQPDGWPYRETAADSITDGSAVNASYNHKRNNDF